MRDFPLRRESSAPGEVMSLERDRVLVGFASPEAAGEADRVLSGLGLMIEQEVEPHRPDDDLSIRFRRPINHTDPRMRRSRLRLASLPKTSRTSDVGTDPSWQCPTPTTNSRLPDPECSIGVSFFGELVSGWTNARMPPSVTSNEGTGPRIKRPHVFTARPSAMGVCTNTDLCRGRGRPYRLVYRSCV